MLRFSLLAISCFLAVGCGSGPATAQDQAFDQELAKMAAKGNKPKVKGKNEPAALAGDKGKPATPPPAGN